MRNVQKLNDWGIQTAIRVADTVTSDGQFVIYADARGGNGNYRHDWGKGFENAIGFTYCDAKDTVIRLITSDYNMFIDGFGELQCLDRKSTRLNSSHVRISYAVFCLKKKKQHQYLHNT